MPERERTDLNLLLFLNFQTDSFPAVPFVYDFPHSDHILTQKNMFLCAVRLYETLICQEGLLNFLQKEKPYLNVIPGFISQRSIGLNSHIFEL